MKIAFVFPGQGAQYVGMGREIAESSPSFMALFEKANQVLGRDLKKIIFEGPEEALKETSNTQPALFVTSLAILEAIKPWQLSPSLVAGHSLGEYSALAAAGAFSFEEGLRLVAIRAEAMSQAAKATHGTMAAILGLDDAAVKEICLAASENESVEPANFNSPGQVVISGTVAAVERAMALAQARGAMKCVPLSVSGPFHSRFMKPAGETLRPHLLQASWKQPTVPLVANVSAKVTQEIPQIQVGLVEQVSSSVLWAESVQTMLGQGIDTFLEIGPGRVLSGLIKKVAKDAKLVNIEDIKSLEKAKASLTA